MRKNSRLPNLRNLGIHLRILIIVNLLTVMAAILLSKDLSDFIALLAQLSALVQPIILLSFLGLYVLYPLIVKVQYAFGIALIFLLELLITILIFNLMHYFFTSDVATDLVRPSLLTILVTGIVLYYFYMQQRAYSPAIAEARLQALQARIRPHFLFNSINAVLSVIRSQPKLAETALEDMADLFRVLMSENRDLVPLSQELALCRQYLALEKLRLDERLNIIWAIENMPPNALIPPLILQPLIENAVYHGIEPMPNGGDIIVTIYTRSKEIHITISNPFTAQNQHHSGNKMALKNIKERLILHFDLEAMLKAEVKDNQYIVHIRLPLHA